ncbi:unnamed protein product, partial [Ectocarpus sp. 12 AP-2014]
PPPPASTPPANILNALFFLSCDRKVGLLDVLQSLWSEARRRLVFLACGGGPLPDDMSRCGAPVLFVRVFVRILFVSIFEYWSPRFQPPRLDRGWGGGKG